MSKLRSKYLCVVIILVVGLGCGRAQKNAGLSSTQASNGLKEALSRGVVTAITETGKPGGYENNPLIKIGMPDRLKTVEKGLRAIGMGNQVDKFEHSMNAAAEQAAPAAKSILMQSLRTMTFDDALKILTGGNTAGTEYFKRTTTVQVSDAFRPIIQKAMASNGVTEKFDGLMKSTPQIPFMKAQTIDINNYVLEKSVDGLFTMMGEEEKKIRTNPAARVTPLLKTVFGKL